MDRLQQRKITRKREFRACTECRRRKLRCDRVRPCINCSRREDATNCVYLQTSNGSKDEKTVRLEAEPRLQHLEELVNQLSESRESSAEARNLAPDQTSVPHGDYDTSSGPVKHGATHWSAMLEDINGLREALDANVLNAIDNDDLEEPRTVQDATGILFGRENVLTLHQVLTRYLPSKQLADRLVGAYFRMKTVAAPCIHTAQFLRLYGLFWQNPSTFSPLWTSILFSVLDIATKIVTPNPTATTGGETEADNFDIAAAQCLVIGEYHRPQRFGIEGLLLFAQARCMTSADIGADIALLFGTLIRLATIGGYHRDPDTFQHKLTPFESEMRRRTWSLLMQLDMLVSFQLGLPSNVQYPTWDIRPPINLLNSDFDEDSLCLPPARPDTDPTELLFYIAKHRLAVVFEKVIRHTLSAPTEQNSEVEAIDEELHRTQAALPTVFHPRPMAESIIDTPSIKVTRLCVNAIYQKCICVLHKTHVTQGRWASVQACYTAASNLVTRFLDVYPEFEPGGQLETERWFMGSLTWNDFLLGCMALCLTVCSTRQHTSYLAIVDVAASAKTLQEAHLICARHSNRSKDTKRVGRVLKATIKALEGQTGAHAPISGNIPEPRSSWPDAHTFIPELSWPTVPHLQDGNDLTPIEHTAFGIGNPEWAYLEQFLDLPNVNLV